MHQDGGSPAEIRFPAAGPLTVKSFLEGYRQVHGLSEAHQFKTIQSFTDRLGQTHHRVKQYYQGIEPAEVQYLLHQKNGEFPAGL